MERLVKFQSKFNRDKSQENATSKKMNNLVVRVLTAVILLPFILFVTLYGQWLLMFVFGILAVIGLLEYAQMDKRWHDSSRTQWGILITGAAFYYAFALNETVISIGILAVGMSGIWIAERLYGRTMSQANRRVLSSIGGCLYIALPLAMLVLIRNIYPFGINWLYAVFFVTWGTDSFAYLAGSAFGKTKLAPLLSPKKTVEGAIGGILAGIFFGTLILLQIEALTPLTFILLCIAPFAAVSGDLFESWLKRSCDVKDSGVDGLNPFPGHGGVLDRIDAMLFVGVVFYVFLLIEGLIPLIA